MRNEFPRTNSPPPAIAALLEKLRTLTEEFDSALRTAVADSLRGDSLKTGIEVDSRPDRVELRIEFDDLPAVLRHRVALGDGS